MSVAEALPAQSRADQDLQGLYERHADRIFGFCRRRLRSHQEAEDAVQTTFLQAFRALQRGVVPVSETAWLFKIAENVCLSAHRSNGRRSDRELADGGEVVAIAPAREVRDDALFGLEEALAEIPESQRRAFVLRELRGLSYKEIAGVAGLSVTAVEMLVFRARRSLAQALESGTLKGRVASLLDLGAALNAVKTVFGGATIAKVATAAAVVAIATVPAGDSSRLAADRSPSTAVLAEPGGRPDGSFDRPSTSRRASSPGLAGARGRPGSPIGSGQTSNAGLPRPGLTGDEPAVPAEPPAGSERSPGDSAPPTAPAQPVPTPGIVPRTPDPVSLPSTPSIDNPTVPGLRVDVPALPIDVPAPPELPVKAPDPSEVELPALPTLP